MLRRLGGNGGGSDESPVDIECASERWDEHWEPPLTEVFVIEYLSVEEVSSIE